MIAKAIVSVVIRTLVLWARVKSRVCRVNVLHGASRVHALPFLHRAMVHSFPHHSNWTQLSRLVAMTALVHDVGDMKTTHEMVLFTAKQEFLWNEMDGWRTTWVNASS